MTVNIKITKDGCVDELHIKNLAGLPTTACLVHAAGIEKIKHLVALIDDDLGDLLVCPITGTIYDAKTGRSSSHQLYIIKQLKSEST